MKTNEYVGTGGNNRDIITTENTIFKNKHMGVIHTSVIYLCDYKNALLNGAIKPENTYSNLNEFNLSMFNDDVEFVFLFEGGQWHEYGA